MSGRPLHMREPNRDVKAYATPAIARHDALQRRAHLIRGKRWRAIHARRPCTADCANQMVDELPVREQRRAIDPRPNARIGATNREVSS
ncbi:hypothetical protein VSR82_00960 [Burkholderia sp. JPY481]